MRAASDGGGWRPMRSRSGGSAGHSDGISRYDSQRRTPTPPLAVRSPQRKRKKERAKRDSDSVTVAVRLRPWLPHELQRSAEGCILLKESTCCVLPQGPKERKRTFTFDHCIGAECGQGPLYDVLGKGLVDTAWKGINASLLAYGQTGSGKTHSIFGPTGKMQVFEPRDGALHPDAGLVPR
eukprot:Sspe_Gene.73637::Locus_44625_Transcript_1_1_Confidence_1.000_Length_587::g.73637::m.73637